MDGGGRGLEPQLVVDELGDGLALERVAVRGAQVARVRRVAVGRGQRRARVRRRDRGQAGVGERRDAADGLVRAGRADEADDRRVGGELLGRGGAALGRAQAVLRGQLDGVIRAACRPSSTAISTPVSASWPSDASAPERTPQNARWRGSPGGMVTTPSGSLGGRGAAARVQARDARSRRRATSAEPRELHEQPVLLPTAPPGRGYGGGSHGGRRRRDAWDRRAGDPARVRHDPAGRSDVTPSEVAGGPQVAADAMPYHSQRRPDCKTGRPAQPMSAFFASSDASCAKRAARRRTVRAGRVAGSTGSIRARPGSPVHARHEPLGRGPPRPPAQRGRSCRQSPRRSWSHPFEVQTRQRGRPDPAARGRGRRSARRPAATSRSPPRGGGPRAAELLRSAPHKGCASSRPRCRIDPASGSMGTLGFSGRRRRRIGTARAARVAPPHASAGRPDRSRSTS